MIKFFYSTTGEYDINTLPDVSESILIDASNNKMVVNGLHEYYFSKLSDLCSSTNQNSSIGLSQKGGYDMFSVIQLALDVLNSSVNVLDASVIDLDSSVRELYLRDIPVFLREDEQGYVLGREWKNNAVGLYSFAEGYDTSAIGEYSHAEGQNTQTTNEAEHASGKYNKSTEEITRFSVGVGTDDNNRKNAFEIVVDSNIYINDIGGYDGTNVDSSVIQSVQQVIKTINTSINDLAEDFATSEILMSENIIDLNEQIDTINSSVNVLDASVIVLDSSVRELYLRDIPVFLREDEQGYVLGREWGNNAVGLYSFAEGYDTSAIGKYSHAEGRETTASGQSSHTEGQNTQTTNDAEHASGKFNKSTSEKTHFSVGVGTNDNNRKNAFEIAVDSSIYINDIGGYDGTNVDSSAVLSVQQVINTVSDYVDSLMLNVDTLVMNVNDANERINTVSDYVDSIVLNVDALILNSSDLYQRVTDAENSIPVFLRENEKGYVLGREWENNAVGLYSFAEGYDTSAIGSCSHAEGYKTTASGISAHTEGRETTASGISAHAEGHGSTASGISGAHAEGRETTASGQSSHAEGYDTSAIGSYSHAEGYRTTASGQSSHTEGQNTQTTNDAEHASGKFNKSTLLKTCFSVGVGTDDNNRKNAFEIAVDSSIYINDIGGYDGTNVDSSAVLSVQQVIKTINTSINDLAEDFNISEILMSENIIDLNEQIDTINSSVNALDASVKLISVPVISTNIITDANSDVKTASPKAVKTYVDSILGDIATALDAINGEVI